MEDAQRRAALLHLASQRRLHLAARRDAHYIRGLTNEAALLAYRDRKLAWFADFKNMLIDW